MKLQNMTVIFIIIMIPIILVVSYYIGLQINTITMQKNYTVKLQTAAKDSIQALEINTVEWNSASSNLADSKRRDVLAAINTFTTSLANGMGIGGAGKGRIQTYIPAIVYTMYDGYYIYSASLMKEQETDNNGLTQFEKGTSGKDTGNIKYNTEGTSSYQYILKPYSPYSARYVTPDNKIDVTVNYTLDNYIRVYGTVNGEYQTKEGYLVVCATSNSGADANIGVYINQSGNNISDIKYRGAEIVPETLKENVYADGEVGEYSYIYDQYDNKLYWDKKADPNEDGVTEGNYFSVDKYNNKVYLQNALPEGDAGFSITNRFRKISIPMLNGSEWTVQKVFQILNPGGDFKFYYENESGAFVEFTAENVLDNVKKDEDYSAINYCVESYVFTQWVTGKLKDIKVGDMPSLTEGQYNNVDKDANIFQISTSNNPDPENDDAYANSPLAQHKKDVIINTIEKNLSQATAQAKEMNPNYEYRLPQLSYDEWEQALSNISIIAFMQGMPIGLKYYNNYAIATSTLNKEYVDPDELYFAGSGDQYYHQRECEQANESNYIGYRSIDYVAKSYEITDASGNKKTKYYYPHDNNDTTNTDSELECYYCLVNRSTYKKEANANWTDPYKNWTDSYYNALARERYMQLDDLEGKYVPETTEFVLSKTVTGTAAYYGDDIEYKIKVTNHSNNKKINVTVIDEFDTNVDNFISITSVSGDGVDFYESSGKQISITINEIAINDTKTITIKGKVKGNVGIYKNTAKIIMDEKEFKSNDVSVTVIKNVKILASSLMPPANIVFIIDASASMVGQRIHNVQNAIEKFVNDMPNDGQSQIGYVKFYTIGLWFIGVPYGDKKGPYTMEQKSDFIADLTFGASGDLLAATPFATGLNSGKKLLKEMKNGNKNINIAIFLSDGVNFYIEIPDYKTRAKELKDVADRVYAIGYKAELATNFQTLRDDIASDKNYFKESKDMEQVFKDIFDDIADKIDKNIDGSSLIESASDISGTSMIGGKWICLKNDSECDFSIDDDNKVKGIDIYTTKIIIKENDVPKENATEGRTLLEWSNTGYIGKSAGYLYLNLSKFSPESSVKLEIVQ